MAPRGRRYSDSMKQREVVNLLVYLLVGWLVGLGPKF